MAEGNKVTFGVRRVGKHKKRPGPKSGHIKSYHRQGR